MRKNILLLLGVLALFSSCMDPLSFDPENIKVEVDIHGNINTTDVTAAVLLLSNQSKTVDVTCVEVRQDEELIVTFHNEPKHLTKKAKYLTPSETGYIISIEYKYYYRDREALEPEGEGKQEITVLLPLPQKIVEVFIYRDVSGEVKIGTERDLTFDQNDTGDPLDDTLVGQGSSPAVIPPENRSRMATFVVVNRTKSQAIDSVRFEMGQSAYTMGAVRVRDKRSIALGQGAWETTLNYKRNDTVITLPPVNSIIVPSNDPQSLNEHYLYFYLNNKDQYRVTAIWPPGDEGEEDILPPDQGFGRGVIKLVNRSDSLVNGITITNHNDDTELKREFNSTAFEPPVPVMRNQIGYVDIVGDGDFPIEGHDNYRVDVTVETGEGAVTITRQTMLKDVIVEIIITPDDLVPGKAPPDDEEPPPQADGTLRIINETNSGITSVTINGGSGRSLLFEAGDFVPPGPIRYYQGARIDVKGTENCPIEEGVEYLIEITLEGSAATVTRQAVIKGAEVTITITPPKVESPDYGQGTIRIINQTSFSATKITITTPDKPDREFTLANPVMYNQSALITVTGNAAFPLEPEKLYTIEVTVEIGYPFTVTRQAVIKNAHVSILIAPQDIPPKVYVAGWYDDGGTRKACYWVDGARVPLEHPAQASSSEATGIAATKSGKVYVSGFYVDADGDKACYWDDGKIIYLTADMIYGYDATTRAVAIAVAEDGSVYVIGWAQYFEDHPDYYWEERFGYLWIDGEEAGDITEGGESEVTGIVFADGMAYVSGLEFWFDNDDNLFSHAIYMEEYEGYGDIYFEKKFLPDEDKYWYQYYRENYSSRALGIAVGDNGNVYTVGCYQFVAPTLTPLVPCYWINDGMPVDLNSFNPAGIEVQAGGIAVSGTTVYIVSCNSGAAGGVPGYWENGTARVLPTPGGGPSDSLAIATSKYGNVYTAGYYGSTPRACYWMNTDNPVFLEDGESRAVTVTVVAR